MSWPPLWLVSVGFFFSERKAKGNSDTVFLFFGGFFIVEIGLFFPFWWWILAGLFYFGFWWRAFGCLQGGWVVVVFNFFNVEKNLMADFLFYLLWWRTRLVISVDDSFYASVYRRLSLKIFVFANLGQKIPKQNCYIIDYIVFVDVFLYC